MTAAFETIQRFWLWAAVIVVAAIAFFAAPGDYGATAMAVLHGLCAQTPSHTIHFGGQPLPFDARMTGIYGGVFVTIVAMLYRGTLLSYGTPPKRTIALLASFVVIMGLDGFNSLFNDLGIWHPWEPSNALRIVTGYGAGVSLAVALGWLLGSSLWRMSAPKPAIGSIRDLDAAGIGLLAFGAVLIWSPGWLHFPVSMTLVISAWMTVSLLMLVMVLLVLKLDISVRSIHQLHVPVATAALLAMSVMLMLAGIRFWFEYTFGISNALM